MTKAKRDAPVLIDLSTAPKAKSNPVIAPPPPEVSSEIAPEIPTETAVHRMVWATTKRRSGGWFVSLLVALITMIVGLWAWDYAAGLLLRNPVLGGIVTALMVLLLLMVALFSLRELAALSRLRRIDRLRTTFSAARRAHDLTPARNAVAMLQNFYDGREDASWGLARLSERQGEVIDSTALLDMAETEVMPRLDRAALAEVERAARQVATVTAIVPMALLDMFSALAVNLRMIRRISEAYGGRAGTLGSWRLTRSVLAHLVATGALAVGDDLIGSIAGGGLLSKLSRRFGEGVINGALTARIGLAAIEVCRPMPFVALPRPKVSGVIKNALTGLFGG